ncbi:hypothetical protein JVX98_13035 [Ensifer sp. PDNC004]|uniref:hypothetical protein n=1 Tax=Ensifer sp. PDNC004 TaxID=2811423 RepID=UPI0019637CC3|nr:hypothetical protein [Ensifer sp. PDNC004]QRY69142.1 hypothetical protein JVX98_13035 [Ensifer sp. PDNC004]
MIVQSYSQLMSENPVFITLKIDTEQPVELHDFVGAFTSLANEFERFVAASYPDAKSDPKMYVREVRYGCIEADMITGFAVAAATHMDQILVLEDFVRRWGRRVTSLITPARATSPEISTSAEFRDFTDAMKSVASDPVASHRLEAVTFSDGLRQVKASFKFTAVDARTALQTIDDRKKLLAKPTSDIHQRVLMIFTRSDVNDADVGKSSGERVMIQSITAKPLALMYGSELAEARIKHEIREADENVYKKGFVVDVALQLRGERPVAFSVMNVHDVVDLTD